MVVPDWAIVERMVITALFRQSWQGRKAVITCRRWLSVRNHG
jgi:hypothetical protein